MSFLGVYPNRCIEVIVRNLDEINQLLVEIEGELTRITARRSELLRQINELQQEKAAFLPLVKTPLQTSPASIMTEQSSEEVKIALFRMLFRGREDVYAKRFENPKTGKRRILASLSQRLGE